MEHIAREDKWQIYVSMKLSREESERQRGIRWYTISDWVYTNYKDVVERSATEIQLGW